MNKGVFIGILLLLFTLELLSPTQTYLVQPFTQGLAMLSAFLIQSVDANVMAQGVVIRDQVSGSAVSIQAGCNGIEAIICLSAAVLAYPASWYAKLVGLLVGFVAIQALNIVRIISLFYLLQWNAHWFEWAHLYVWQALIFLDVLIVFIVWIRWITSTPDPSSKRTITYDSV